MRTLIKLKQVIPEEIIEEILCYLPVKSLLRFKCVSKQWHSFISSEYFIKKHLKKKSLCAEEGTDNSKLIFSFQYNKTQFLSLGSCSLRDDEPVVKTNLDIQTVERIQILGSCNGLVLLTIVSTGDLILWNPSTRETKNIKPALFLHGGGYGLGYDELTDDYKVVCIKCWNHYRTYTHMYSSKTDSWKEFESLDKFVLKNNGKFVNGKLHWLVFKYGCGWDIVALHLVEEKHEIVAWPECISNISCPPGLRNLGGYLSLIDFSSFRFNIDVWVMIEYGARESWTKIWTFSDFCDRPIKDVPRAIPLCFKKNGDIAVAFGSDVAVYNGKKLLRSSRVDKFEGLIDYIPYVESLVSPFGDETSVSPFLHVINN